LGGFGYIVFREEEEKIRKREKRKKVGGIYLQDILFM